MPNANLSENEITAAKTVKFDYWNTQHQQKFVWPPRFALARAYLDQLARSDGLPSEMLASAKAASKVDAAAGSSSDAAKVRMLSGALTDLANATR